MNIKNVTHALSIKRRSISEEEQRGNAADLILFQRFRMLFLPLFFLLSCSAKSSTIDTLSRRVQILDIPYPTPVDGDSLSTKLDIYYVLDDKPKKLMVFIHGGSWIGGDKSNLRTKADAMIQWFLDRDYVVAVPNFRLASTPRESLVVTYREQATDIVYALAWLKENCTEYGVEDRNMLLIGYSSGAHLAPLITSDSSYFRLVGLSFEDIAGVVSLDVHAYDVPFALQLMEGSDVEHNIPLIKFLFGNTEAEQLKASPAFYVSEAPVPPMLVVSVGESSVSGSVGSITSRASQRYAQLLSDNGHRATWRHYDSETHPSLVFDFGTTGDEPTNAVESFINSLK